MIYVDIIIEVLFNINWFILSYVLCFVNICIWILKKVYFGIWIYVCFFEEFILC